MLQFVQEGSKRNKISNKLVLFFLSNNCSSLQHFLIISPKTETKLSIYPSDSNKHLGISLAHIYIIQPPLKHRSPQQPSEITPEIKTLKLEF